ncbi:hypothetical protein [Martelella radicis]|uniref:Uncharacterized protein n=1 Tax=Martelella radicis TaxID=1397476 RepID=A0A7W6PAZ9_9HYPH|nr:hypothetical protein [Martelella radicis]MBB4122124.1 hypothetical protein [Martelella radicis]
MTGNLQAAQGFWGVPAYQALPAGGSGVLGPGAVLDIGRDRYALTRLAVAAIPAAAASELAALSACSFEKLITFTRSATATYVGSDGLIHSAAANAPRFDHTNGRRQLLLEGPATNLLLNSAVLSTQSVAVPAATYTLSFYGTGSVTLAGASSGSLSGFGSTTRVSLTFVATAGALTMTVAGSVANAQLESGSRASSYIPTTGSAATRPADSARLTDAAAELVRRDAVSILVQAFQPFETGSTRRWMGTSYTILGLDTGKKPSQWDGAGPLLSVSSGVNDQVDLGFGVAWDGSGRRMSIAGASAGDAHQPAFTGNVFLGRDNSGNFAPGWYDQLIIWPFRMTNADLAAKAAAYT